MLSFLEKDKAIRNEIKARISEIKLALSQFSKFLEDDSVFVEEAEYIAWKDKYGIFHKLIKKPNTIIGFVFKLLSNFKKHQALKQVFFAQEEEALIKDFLRTYENSKYYIQQHNRKYELREEITLLELLSTAGGVKDTAGSEAIIRRIHNSEHDGAGISKINLRRLLEEGDTTQNVALMDQDSIYISKADLFYINGQVKRPAAYRWDRETTLFKAVTMAGGFTGIASNRRIKIIRKINGKETVIKRAKMDEPILPDDIIVVPESFF